MAGYPLNHERLVKLRLLQSVNAISSGSESTSSSSHSVSGHNCLLKPALDLLAIGVVICVGAD